jgi:flagellar motor switch protein FliG
MKIKVDDSELKSLEDLSRLEMAAVLLMTLGEECAADVLKHLGPKEVQKVGGAMVGLENISNEQVQAVMSSLIDEVENQSGLGVGSDAYIKSMLVKALGSEKAGSLVDRIMLGGRSSGLDTLKWMDARSVSEIIRYEHPQIQAIVLSYLDADHAAQVMTNIQDPRVKLDVIMRVASLESVQPKALQELNEILESQFTGSAGTPSSSLGGSKVAAEIMNNVESTLESEIMASIAEIDEDLAKELQDLMFVFENLVDIDDRGIQLLLREVASETLILALRGADEFMKDKIFGNMSKRASELLKDDLEALGPVRVSEVEAAQKEILAVARKMAESGEIVMGGGGEELI